MKRLFFIILAGVILIVLVGAIIAGSNIITAEKDIEALLTVNKSFLVRTQFYSEILRLKESFDKAGSNYEQIKEGLKEINQDLNKCYHCHQNDYIRANIDRIRSKVLYFITAKHTNRSSSVYFSDIYNFARLSYIKGMELFVSHTSSAKSAIDSAKITTVVTLFFGLIALIVFSVVTLMKIDHLEKNIKDREYTLEQWAMNWQDTFDSVSDMIAIIGDDCKIITSNEAMNRFLQDKLTSENICKTLGLVTENGQCIKNSITKIYEQDEKTYSIRTYKRKNSKGCILVIRDITQETELEKKLLQQEKLAAIGMMAAGIAHELRNPLTGIMGYSEILRHKNNQLDSKTLTMLDRIYYAATKMERIISDLLAFSRKIQLKKVKTNINELIDGVIENITETVSYRNIKIVKEYSPLPEFNIDKGLVEQVIFNIVINAVQAIEDSHIGDTIKVKTFSKNNKVMIQIVDNGPGMSKETTDRIFEPFFTTKEPGKGTGLGLSICYSFIKAHGGEIDVKSTKGKGSVFTIELPVKPANLVLHQV